MHRDLKPANLFLTRRLDGSALVKVLDFGIAKAPVGADASLTRTDVVMGTPGYMAPEQLRSARDVDTRADIWALGVILYQALSGRLPFPAGSLTEIAVKIAMDAPDPIDLSPGLRAIVMRCLEKDRDRRFRDVGELVNALAPFGPPSVAANASMIARLSIASGTSATVAAQPTPFAAVPTTLQGASASMQPTMPVHRGRGTGLWIGGVIVACAAIAGVAVLAQHKDAAQPAPAPIVAADAGIAIASIDAQELALVAPEPDAGAPPEDPRLQLPSSSLQRRRASRGRSLTRRRTAVRSASLPTRSRRIICIRAARLMAQLPGDSTRASKSVSARTIA